MKKETLRYSASKLHQKGILHSIDGLPENQFKNVLFEIVPTDTDGLFTIHAKFMGVRMEHVEVDIQDLLQVNIWGIWQKKFFFKLPETEIWLIAWPVTYFAASIRRNFGDGHVWQSKDQR